MSLIKYHIKGRKVIMQVGPKLCDFPRETIQSQLFEDIFKRTLFTVTSGRHKCRLIELPHHVLGTEPTLFWEDEKNSMAVALEAKKIIDIEGIYDVFA